MSTRPIVRRRSVHLRANDTVCRFVDEERIEPAYPRDKENPAHLEDGEKVLSDALLPQLPKSDSVPPPLPKRAEQIVLLIFPKKIREYLIGDLAEEYAEVAAKHSTKFAKVWYWKQVAASAWPFLKKALTWGLLASTWEWVRRLI